MTNEEIILNVIRHKIDKLSMCFGGFENVCCLEHPVHSCDPNRENGYHAVAVKLDGYLFELGRAKWDFDDEKNELSEYDLESDYSFDASETYDITDPDDAEEIKRVLEI